MYTCFNISYILTDKNSLSCTQGINLATKGNEDIIKCIQLYDKRNQTNKY